MSASAQANPTICVQQGLAALGFDPGAVNGIVGLATQRAADGLLDAQPAPIARLTAENADNWCLLVLSRVVDLRLATAAEWLDIAAVAYPRNLPEAWRDYLLDHLDGGRALLQGGAYRTSFEGKPWVVMIHTSAICEDVYGNTGHAPQGADDVIAKVTFCSGLLAKTEHAQVQAVLHEIFHVMNGMGECGPIWFESWVSFIATRAYVQSDFDWQENGCGDPIVLPPTA